MSIKKLTWSQVMQKFDEFEQKFATEPRDESLPQFFETFGQIINESGYSTEQLKEIRIRMLRLREIFAEGKKKLASQSKDAFDRHKQVSQYIKTSQIKHKN
jgi:hypothetical protein